jgi:phosphoglycolate phosphatase
LPANVQRVLQLTFMLDAKFSAVRALIFDLDGTLIDSKLDLIHSVNAMMREMKRPQLATETISGYIGHGAPQLVARALGGTATEEEIKHALQFFLGYYEGHKMDNTCAYPGVGETLPHLSKLPMAVLTNKPVRISVRILNSLGLAKYFQAIYGGNSFESKKPDPFGANKILQEFGIAAHEALIVGDSEVDIQTARNAGTHAAAVNYGFGVHDRAAYPADIYLDRFTDLAEIVGNHTADRTASPPGA